MSLSKNARKRLAASIGDKSLADEISTAIEAGGATTKSIELVVDVSGSDSNPGTPRAPLRTIQAALDSLPNTIKHPVTIKVGAGNFDGFIIDGFNIRIARAGGTSGILIQGTGVAPTLTTGTTTGTATAFVALTTSSTLGQQAVTPAVLTDSGQSWVINELEGRFVRFTSGTGAGPTWFVIQANTATTMTILGSPSAGVGTGYEILDPGTVITNPVPTVTSVGSGLIAAAGIQIGCNSAYTGGTEIGISQMKLAYSATASPNGIIIDGLSRFDIRHCRFSLSGSSVVPIIMQKGTNGTILDCYFDLTAGTGITHAITSAQITSSSEGLIMTGCYVKGGTYGILLGAAYAQIRRSYFVAQTTAAISLGTNILPANTQFTQISTSILDSTATGVSMSGGNALAQPIGSIALANCHIIGCTYGILADSPGAMLQIAAVSGTTNTYGINIGRGGRAKVSATTGLGGTTADILIDGATQSLATMRAATPKHVKDSNYFTVVFE